MRFLNVVPLVCFADAACPTPLERPSYAPLESSSDLRCIVESEHPYRPGEDRNWPVVIKGAETVEVSKVDD